MQVSTVPVQTASGVPVQTAPGVPVSMPGIPMQPVPGVPVPMPGVPMQPVPGVPVPMPGVPMQPVPGVPVPMPGVPMQPVPGVPVPMPGVPMQPAFPMAAPVVNQPQGQPQSNVVLNIQNAPVLPQMGRPESFNPIAWSTGLFQCFEDIPMCLLGCLCPFILPCYLSALFGEVCFFGVLPGAMFALRTGLRERYKIPGNLLNDYCAICCCLVCAQCQMVREIKGREWQHTKFPRPRAHFHVNFNRH